MTSRRAMIFLSSIVLIGTILLWVQSPRRSYVFAFRSPRGYLNGVASDRGGILFVTTGMQVDGEYGPPESKGRETIRNYGFLNVPAAEFATVHDDTFAAPATTWRIAGFRAAAGDFALFTGPPPSPYRALLLPYWFLLVISAPLPLAAARRFIQRTRWKWTGRCLFCGYDLRASGGRCPECGNETLTGTSRAAPHSSQAVSS